MENISFRFSSNSFYNILVSHIFSLNIFCSLGFHVTSQVSSQLPALTCAVFHVCFLRLFYSYNCIILTTLQNRKCEKMHNATAQHYNVSGNASFVVSKEILILSNNSCMEEFNAILLIRGNILLVMHNIHTNHQQ